MRFAICNEQFEGWEFDRVCRFVSSVGYEGLEVAPFTLAPSITDVSPQRRAELRLQANDAGVDIFGLHWLLAKTEGLYLTSPDAGVRRRTAAYLGSLAEACHDFGGTVMVFGSPKQRSLLPGVSSDQAYGWAAETFRDAMPAIADCGVTLCMEPLSPAETDFVNTCADGLRLGAMVNHPNFVLHLDVKAMSSEPTPVPELIRRHGGSAGHFHANDANLRGPGFGPIDFVPIFRALRDASYSRWVSVEVFDYTPDPETIARQSIDYMQKCLAARDT
ncbi:MAG: sugar phosphate isomerase/epimerase [Acidobacteriota bacterium]|nr:sugar phosphate isomerase/epimerase [Acidobacteriota bacterium]